MTDYTRAVASAWAFSDYEKTRGRAFRARLERKVTRHMEREMKMREAPEEVISRRVNGVEVVARRR